MVGGFERILGGMGWEKQTINHLLNSYLKNLLKTCYSLKKSIIQVYIINQHVIKATKSNTNNLLKYKEK